MFSRVEDFTIHFPGALLIWWSRDRMTGWHTTPYFSCLCGLHTHREIKWFSDGDCPCGEQCLSLNRAPVHSPTDKPTTA